MTELKNGERKIKRNTVSNGSDDTKKTKKKFLLRRKRSIGLRKIMKSRASSYPRFHIIFTKKGKVVCKCHSVKKGRILFRIRRVKDKLFSWDKCYLKFSYTADEINVGIYKNYYRLLKAYRCFEELLEEYK